MILCKHGIPLTNPCASCQGAPVDLTKELLHYSVCIKKWDGKLREAIAANNLEDAAFYARAVGNEYSRLSQMLHEEHQRLTKSPG